MEHETTSAVAGPVERRVMPRAWAVFAPNGNVRLWSTDSEPVRKLAEKEGLPLVPLYELDEMSPEFTDTARAALLWVLWHHQGGSSPVGQPIRYTLGMGAHEPLSEHQVHEAQRWAALTKSETRDFHGR